jgi:hypothetical protein
MRTISAVRSLFSELSEKPGGRTRARTWDPLIKSQLLYQLSYAPEKLSIRESLCKAGRLAR